MVKESKSGISPSPFVTVILPVLDEARSIGPTLAAVLDGDYPADRIEVVVVDGGSTDGTIAVVDAIAERDPRVRRLDNPAGTTPAGLNVGVRAARGDVIVRMDGHALPASDYARACVEALARTGAWVVGGRMVGRGETPVGRATAWVAATRLGAGGALFRLGGAGPTDTVYLGAWPRAVFDDVGLFDEGLARNQDYELCARIRAAGGTVWLDPAIRSTTLARGTLGALARQYFGYGLGRAGTLDRHPRSLQLRQFLPALWLALLGVTGVAAAVGLASWWPFALVAAPYLAATLGAAAVAIPRLGWRDAVHVPFVLWIMHLSWAAGLWVGLIRAASGAVVARAGRGRRAGAGVA